MIKNAMIFYNIFRYLDLESNRIWMNLDESGFPLLVEIIPADLLKSIHIKVHKVAVN